jgi:hypothetical protein
VTDSRHETVAHAIVLAVTASTWLSQIPTPPRHASAVGSATAILRGRVVSSAKELPLHRVKLTLNGDATNAPVAVTDTRGEFEFLDARRAPTPSAQPERAISRRSMASTSARGGPADEVEPGAVIEDVQIEIPAAACSPVASPTSREILRQACGLKLSSFATSMAGAPSLLRRRPPPHCSSRQLQRH